MNGCDSSYNSCVTAVCDPSFPCYGVRALLRAEYAPALGNECNRCAGAFPVCETSDWLACEAERAAVNTSPERAQLRAELLECIGYPDRGHLRGRDCNVANPEETTIAEPERLHPSSLPDRRSLGIGSWLNGIISGLVNWALNIESRSPASSSRRRERAC